MPIWYLYIIRCRDNSLYTGIATDVGRRVVDHNHGRGAKYLRGRGPLKLAFSAKAGSRSRALRIEYRVKRMTKAEKERLVALQRLPVLSRKNREKEGARSAPPAGSSGFTRKSR